MKLSALLLAGALIAPLSLSATHLVGASIVDKDHIMLHYRDGEVRYHDDATGPTAFLNHSFFGTIDTLKVLGNRLDTGNVSVTSRWRVGSTDDPDFARQLPAAVYRKSKPMNTDHRLASELDHWVYVKLPQSMRQGHTYYVSSNRLLGSDRDSIALKYDIWNSPSEAVHVNIVGYHPGATRNHADLYLWLGDGGMRDYSAWEGRGEVWLLNTATGEKTPIGKVEKWKSQADTIHEPGRRNLTGSDVWRIDFPQTAPGRYRLVVEDVGCSMDFDVDEEVYREPYRYSVRGYYYMRLGEPIDTPRVWPVPRQPQFIAGRDVKLYKTDLTPWSPEWRALRMDVWDEPHFKPAEESLFYKHRTSDVPVEVGAIGGHSDACDWDRHLAHVSNIYDLLLPYILSGGRLNEDNLGIRESGNGIPDLLDEARNEVDFFLSIRDGEAYSQGVTNPSLDWTTMFQAGCTTMAAWANAANCAMMAEALRIHGDKKLCKYYTDEAIKAFRFAERQEDKMEDQAQHIGDVAMRPADFRQMAAAYLYNVTGDRRWEDIAVRESMISRDNPRLYNQLRWREPGTPYCQLWGAAAYLTSPRKRHYKSHYRDLVNAVNSHADSLNMAMYSLRPSRRTTSDQRIRTAQNVHPLILAHYLATDPVRRRDIEQMLYAEADWGLGRNPSNIVEMTGLGQRHYENVYSSGHNDGDPGTHPGQTPFNGIEVWSTDNGGDATILANRCYPAWETWPQQESYFNQRYLWVNSEFTPRQTMRGKNLLLAYLYSLR